MKKFLMVLLAAAMVVAGSVAAFADGTYDAGDVAIMNDIIENHWAGDNKPPKGTTSSIPEEWDEYIRWEAVGGTNRIIEIDIEYGKYSKNDRLEGDLDLTGLTYLRRLTLDNNGDNQGLTSLDVSGLKNLTYMFCGSNNLARLELSGCTELDTLLCGSYTIGYGGFGGNSLTSIDLSDLTKLRGLRLSGGNLESIDLRNNPNLTSLAIGSNQLKELDLSYTPKLTILSCPSNQLTSLDLSKVPNLTQLDLGDNPLSEFDLSGLSDLEYLSCADLGLTSLDLSDKEKLNVLFCQNNELTSVKLSPKSEFQLLNVSYNNLTGRAAITGFDWDKYDADPPTGYRFLPQNDGVDPGDLPETPVFDPTAPVPSHSNNDDAAKERDPNESNRQAEEAAMKAVEAAAEGDTAKLQTAVTAAGTTVSAVPVKLYGLGAYLSLDSMETMAGASVGLKVSLEGGAAEVLIPGGFAMPNDPGRVYYPLGYQKDPYGTDTMRSLVKGADARTEVCRLGGGSLPTTVTVTLKTKLTGTVNIYCWNEETRRATLLATATAENGRVVFAAKQLGNLILTTGAI